MKDPHWNGPAGRGAKRTRRGIKNNEAQYRNEQTPHDRTRKHRLGKCDCKQAA